MTLPTIETVVNFYLYGQSNPNPGAPERPIDATSTMNVDMTEYMNGPGRFADPSRFYIVQDFFNAPPGTFSAGRQYSFLEIKTILETNHPEKHYTDTWNKQQYELWDSSTTPQEWFERTFTHCEWRFS